MPINNDVQIEKSLLRKRLINSRKKIEPGRKTSMDLSIFEALISIEQYKMASTILTYVSTDIEVDTLILIEYALKEGKIVAAPICDYDTTTIKFYQIKSRDELYPAKFSLLEPIANDERLVSSMQKSICIVPGLAFDKKGYRLGYGKGFYDRFLSEYDGQSIGVCYADYICDRLVIDKYDIPVDLIVTDNPADKNFNQKDCRI